MIMPIVTYGMTCDLNVDTQTSNSREITCDMENRTITNYKTNGPVEVLSNSVCKVKCSESLTLSIDPVKKTLAGMSITYPMYVSGERQCEASYEYDNYSKKIKALTDEYKVANNNSLQKTIKVVFHRNASSGDTTTVTEEFTTEDIGNRFGYNKKGSALHKTGNKQTGSFGNFTKSGYSLLGWSTNKNATEAELEPYQSVTDDWIKRKVNETGGTIHLYGVWKQTTAADEVSFMTTDLILYRNLDSSDNEKTTQHFVLGRMINKIGYNADGSSLYNQTGQYGAWSKSGYVALGWSTNRNATRPELDLYQIITDEYIRSHPGEVRLYLVWGKLPTLETSRKTDEIAREITNLNLEKQACDNFTRKGEEGFNEYKLEADVNLIVQTSTSNVNVPYHYIETSEYSNAAIMDEIDYDGCEIDLRTYTCKAITSTIKGWKETATISGKYTMMDTYLKEYTGEVEGLRTLNNCNAKDRYFIDLTEKTKPLSGDALDRGYALTLEVKNLGNNMRASERSNWDLTVHCNYQVKNLIYPQQDATGNCVDENCEKYGTTAFQYRIVDLSDPFPSREAGANWKGKEEIITSTKDIISTLRRFEINLSRTKIKKIREYNEINSYENFDFKDGKSIFIENMKGIIDRKGTTKKETTSKDNTINKGSYNNNNNTQ